MKLKKKKEKKGGGGKLLFCILISISIKRGSKTQTPTLVQSGKTTSDHKKTLPRISAGVYDKVNSQLLLTDQFVTVLIVVISLIPDNTDFITCFWVVVLFLFFLGQVELGEFY